MIELNEMLIKFGRRVTHDLDHSLSRGSIHSLHSNDLDSYLVDRLRDRCAQWKAIFYPVFGAKDYRSRIHNENEKLSKEVARLKMLCEQNGIDHSNDEELPF